jgi:flagellar protein FliJ
MRKFSFNLETLRRYRGNIEDKERFALARMNWVLQAAVEELNVLCRREQEAVAELTRLRTAPSCDDPDIQMYYTYLKRLRLGISQSQNQIARLEKEIQAQKLAVIEAARKKKVLDVLKAKRERQFAATVEKLEQKLIDDIVVSRFARKES